MVRIWITIQYLIVIAYFIFTVLVWGPMVVLALAIVTVPLIAFLRLEHTAVRLGIATQEDLRTLAVVFLVLGSFLAVLPYILSEMYWFLKEALFGVGRANLFWLTGRNAFIIVVIPVPIAWCYRTFKSRVARAGSEGLQRLQSSFVAVVWLLGILSRPYKFIGLVVLANFFVVGFAFGIGGVLVLFGNYSLEQTFFEPSIRIEFFMMVCGLLISLVPIYFLTCWWWKKESLVEAFVGHEVSKSSSEWSMRQNPLEVRKYRTRLFR